MARMGCGPGVIMDDRFALCARRPTEEWIRLGISGVRLREAVIRVAVDSKRHCPLGALRP
ncbi:hypothetical protein GCM10018771_67320 [Streptomyces cellulosae]|nr:hypothetical protein GCM10018771_67320 [Streptomyces cellulosae]